MLQLLRSIFVYKPIQILLTIIKIKLMDSTSKQEAKRVFVLGALGAGKSTVLNNISAAGMSTDCVRFAASNSTAACT